MAGGRPSKYQDEFVERVRGEAASRGATWPVIARLCEVNEATVKDWCDTKSPRYKPAFSAAVKLAKAERDDAVEEALAAAATGGLKIDTTAAIFWLCNRRPDRWRHVQRMEHTGADGAALSVTALVREAAE